MFKRLRSWMKFFKMPWNPPLPSLKFFLIARQACDFLMSIIPFITIRIYQILIDTLCTLSFFYDASDPATKPYRSTIPDQNGNRVYDSSENYYTMPVVIQSPLPRFVIQVGKSSSRQSGCRLADAFNEFYNKET